MKRKPETASSRKNMRGLRLVGEGENGSVLSPYGPVNQGLTISQRTQLAQLEGLVSSLEKRVSTLESKYYEQVATCSLVIARLVELGVIGSRLDLITIDEVDEKG